MEKLKEELKYDKKGITLISLVITIIVLLILAGVTIAILIGDNGILNRATEAKNKIEEAEELEALKLSITSSQMEDINTLEIKKEALENAIKQQFGNSKDFTITDNNDGSFLVNMNDTQRMYYIDESGEIIGQSKILKISTADELKAFRDDVNSGNTYEGWYVYLTNNIILDLNEEWEPVGFYSQDTENIKKVLENEKNNPFKGIFDGKGYTIDNVYINTSDICKGIFGLVIDGEIKNINLGKNSILSMSGSATGGIVGYMYGTGKISNCKNHADIEQTRGGIVGIIAGSIIIRDCINYGNLDNASGGIVGSSNGRDWEEFVEVQHTIINCGNYGNIIKNTDSDFLGGIVGYFHGTISDSFNTGNITMNANRNNTGGLVGCINGNILNCYNVGYVEGYNIVGGLAGLLSNQTNNLFKNNYNIGNIQGRGENVEKLVGLNESMTQLQNSYTNLDTFTAKNLGAAYKSDTNNMNNGYPILTWQ